MEILDTIKQTDILHIIMQTDIFNEVAIIIIIIPITYIFFTLSKIFAKRRKRLVRKSWLREDYLLEKLGWDKVIFPIKISWWKWAQTITIHSLKKYTKDFLYWWYDAGSLKAWCWAKNVIDAKKNEYTTTRISAKNLWISSWLFPITLEWIRRV